MLKPRSSAVHPLSICLTLGSIAALGLFGGFVGCQGPDTFLRGPGSGGNNGSAGTSFGSGGKVGAGGTTSGFGGNTSGFGGNTSGFGGNTSSSGGSGMGGRIGTGGSAMGGMTGGAGMTGSGGARDAGADMMMTGAGGAIVVDANADSEVGVVADGPCMGLCAPAVTYSQPPNFGSPQFTAVQSACYQTLSPVHGGGCSNCGGRINTINGVSVPVSGWPSTLPAPVRGGYCIQISVGQPDGGAVDYASFYTF